MSDLIYEREMDVAYNADELAASLRKREHTAWRLVSVCVCADGSYAVWERSLLKPAPRPACCTYCGGSGRVVSMDEPFCRCDRCDGRGWMPPPVETPAPADPAPCPVDVALSKLRAEHASVLKSLESSGDRRDWNSSTSDGYKLEAIESVIEVLERAKAEASR